MLPTPETSYSSCEMMIQSRNTFTYSQGYVVTKQHSAANANRLTNCPFTVYGRLLKADKHWHLTVRNVEHNHEPSDNIAGHPYDKSKPFFDYKATVGSVITVIKKTTKVSSSEGNFKTVASRKKRKSGVLAKSVDNSEVADKVLSNHSWDSEVGDTTESESIDMKEKCLVKETSVDYGENGAFAGENPDQMPKSLHVKTKKVLEKSLDMIDYGTVNVDDDVLDGFFLLPPSLPIKPSVQVPVHKSFVLDIDLVAIAGKSSQEKLNFVRKIFSDMNGFGGVSAPSKFGGIIQASFTSKKAMMAAA
ncbi:hypothetical protein G9A89_000104 [Geosiphon pyriformis]|nr:hypothetical protein G9A89_000104 [Geosiphon pyriformis]